MPYPYRSLNEQYFATKERELRRLKAINQRHAWLRRNGARIREYIKRNKQLQEEIIDQYLILLAEQGPSAIPEDLEMQYNTLQREAENITFPSPSNK